MSTWTAKLNMNDNITHEINNFNAYSVENGFYIFYWTKETEEDNRFNNTTYAHQELHFNASEISTVLIEEDEEDDTVSTPCLPN